MKQVLEFANLICRFGDKAVLLDHYEDIVAPAMLGSAAKYHRQYGDANYFLHGTRVLMVDDPDMGEVPVIAGRIVKDTIVRSEQIYDDGRLRARSKVMKSSPSSMFVLILHNHRLLFVREMRDAPKLDQFTLLVQEILRIRWDAFIRSNNDWSRAFGNEFSKLSSRREALPRPNVTVLPFPAATEISGQIRKFKSLNEIDIVFRGTNHDLDNSGFFKKLHEQADELNADNAKLLYRAKDGLDKVAATKEVVDASSSGNQEVILRGIDHAGNKLKVDQSDFQLSKSLSTRVGKQIPAAAAKLYDYFVEVAKKGLVDIGTLTDDILQRIKGIRP